MKSSFLLIIATFFFLLLGLYFILPRRDSADDPLVQEINITEVGEEEAQAEEAPTPTPVSAAMETTLRQFLDAVMNLKEEASAANITAAHRHLSPALQESIAANGVNRDDFVVLFDQTTKDFPPTEYEIVSTKVINENIEEANVRFKYPEAVEVVYNVELERINNEWKVVTISPIK